jgi:hypothetical protein
MVGVELFPQQTETDGLYVIVLAATGIEYSNQCGGTACDQQCAEGFLVPVGTPQDLAEVKGWFLQHFGESCRCDGRLAMDPVVVQELAAVIEKVPCWYEGNPVPLQLDGERLRLGGEAWVPVRSTVWPGLAYLDEQ